MGRFREGREWRFVFTTLAGATTTWAQGLLTNRQIALTLDQPSTIDAAVWPDDPRVNQIYTDGYPLVAQSNRLVFGLRREPVTGTTIQPWVCRAAGILMSPNDEGNPDVAVSHFTAYDPWKLLEARPVMDSAGVLPGPDGFSVFNTGDQVALVFLKNTIEREGTVHIDAGVAYGGTGFYTGTIETTDPIAYVAQNGVMVAEVWNDLVNAGNLDIVLTPIYDPHNRPGYTHELSIYRLAGRARYAAIFAWDRFNRSIASISRSHDGTPGAFFDKVQYFAGQAGAPVPATGPLINAAAVAAFGSYWSQQFFPAQVDTDPTGAAVLAMAQQAIELAKQGKRSLTLALVPDRAPDAFIEYGLGDRAPVYATKRLRVTADGLQRIQAIPIDIDDDGVERITALLTSPDWRGNDPLPPGGGAIATTLASRTAAAIRRASITPTRRTYGGLH